MRIVVVGAGLFGSIIAETLHKARHHVTTVADQRPDMGSVPAACLMKPSWAASVHPTDYLEAGRLLDMLYGVQSIEFDVRLPNVGITAKTTCHWVDPAKVLGPPNIHGRMVRLDPDGIIVAPVEPAAPGAAAGLVNADHTIICAGPFTNELVGLPKRTVAKGGWAFLFPGQLERPFIQTWAPYKQIVAFNRDPEHIWVGDGSALLPTSMTDERMQASLRRCAAAIGAQPEAARVLRGFRPYVEGGLKEPAYIFDHQNIPNVTIVTGGAKNGTLGAAWAARKLMEKLS